MEMPDLHYVEGTVSAVLYRNEENGYTILRLENGDEDDISVVGCMPGVAVGESLSVHGTWEQHSTYGRQLRAEYLERRLPSGENAMLRYLASGAVRGIGAVTARRIMDEFGTDALRILEESPEQLSVIQGITRKRALAMSDAFRLQLSLRQLLDFLAAYQMPLGIAMPLYRRFGEEAFAVLRENPYVLTEDSIGASFHHADALAQGMGLSVENPLRLEAGLRFELQHNAENGHVFLPQEKLLGATAQLLQMDTGMLVPALDALLDKGEVILSPIAKQNACYLARFYEAECAVAERLHAMAGNLLYPDMDFGAFFARIEAETGMEYAPLQKDAVVLAGGRQVLLLTGGPGTGKTTTTRAVLALFDALGLDTVLTAPTGRAAKRLSDACGREASTVHRLLETKFDGGNNALRFARNAQNPLYADAVIVDEASMVDLPLMAALLDALPLSCRLILVGDPHQLPSVGAGNVLSDLLRADSLPTLQLHEIFRQASLSSIIRSAHSVQQGTVPPLQNSLTGDFFFLKRLEGQHALSTVVELCQTRLPKNMGIDPQDIQVLTPTRKGTLGTQSLNTALQAVLNPPQEGKPEKAYGSWVFRQGDRVMQVKNNYELLWEDSEKQETGMGIFNGDIGQIVAVDAKAGLVQVNFEGRLAEYTSEILHQLEPAWAITVHKSQGSEYRAVILCLHETASALQTRAVLYTGMTRAKDLLILVGDDMLIAKMTQNNRPTRRYSGLRARLVRLRKEHEAE